MGKKAPYQYRNPSLSRKKRIEVFLKTHGTIIIYIYIYIHSNNRNYLDVLNKGAEKTLEYSKKSSKLVENENSYDFLDKGPESFREQTQVE